MMDFGSILKTPFRPRQGFEALAGKMNLAWIPCLVFLLLALFARVTVETPRQIAFQQEAIKAQTAKMDAEMRAQGVSTSEVGGVTVVESDGSTSADAKSDASGDVAAPVEGEIITPEAAGMDNTAQTITWVSNYVFGIVGALASVLVTALVFFVAGKVGTATANFRTFLSITTLSFVPLGLRDFVQAGYMTLADTYIRHQGLSSLVAPKDPLVSGGIAYGVLGLADVWTLWAIGLLYAGLRWGAGLDRKRSLIAWAVFVGAVLAMRVAAGGVVQLLSGGF
jgi:hypothetical protein